MYSSFTIQMDPLLTEFDEQKKLGHLLGKLPLISFVLDSESDLRGAKLARVYMTCALLGSVLSVLCNAAIFTLTLSASDPSDPKKLITFPISFGYLYEMNAAFLYVVLAPLFVFIGMRFIGSAEFAFARLSDSKLLVANPKSPQVSIPVNPLTILGDMNRRFFKPIFIIVIGLVSATIIIGTEFRPGGGDYAHVAFGYVQAQFIEGYRGKTVAELQSAGRAVNPIPGIPDNLLPTLKIEKVEGGRSGVGPQGVFQTIIFWLFIVFALGVQVIFVPFTIWIFFKAIFFLRVVHKAICSGSDSPLQLKLDFEDNRKAFGLLYLYKPYNWLVAMIFVGALTMTSSVLTNVGKGSHRVFSIAGAATPPVLPSVGQFTVAFLPAAVFVVLGLYFFFLRLRTEKASEQRVEELKTQIVRYPSRKAETEKRINRTIDQKAWPDFLFKTWFGAALPCYIAPPLLLSQFPVVAIEICLMWKAVAAFFERMISIFRVYF